MANPYGLYTVNYYTTSDNSTTYASSLTLHDLNQARSLGFNTVRMFLWANSSSAYSTGPYDFPTPTSGQLAILTDFCAQAATAGVKLHVTLFDHWSEYGQINGSKTWATAVIGALDLNQVACIELQNEIRYSWTASYTSGFDAGWPGYPTVPSSPTIGGTAIIWAQQMIPYIRSFAGSVPIVNSNTNYNALYDLSAAVTNLTGAALPDWFEWHCYAGQAYVGDITSIMSSLSGAISVVGNAAPLYIGETGASSYVTGTMTASSAPQYQSDYVQAVRWCCQQLGLPEPAPWALYDGSVTQTGTQAYYGLISVPNGSLKPVATMYQQHPPGTMVPGLDINGTMVGAITDTDGNILPARWSTYRGNTGTQPITITVDATTYHGRSQSIVLSGFSGTSSSDNPPAVQYYPAGAGWPQYTSGLSYTFDVWLKGSGSVGAGNGLPALTISWYQSSAAYISGTNTAAIDLSSGNWVHATVSSTMPANAGYARIFVRVGYGTRQVWVSDARWTGPNGRMLTNLTAHYRRAS